MLFVLHKNVNTVNLTCEIIMFFSLLVAMSTPLELQVMTGVKCLHNIFKRGCEIKKGGNH